MVHQSSCTIELHLSDNAVRLKIRDSETRTPAPNEINLAPKVGTYTNVNTNRPIQSWVLPPQLEVSKSHG